MLRPFDTGLEAIRRLWDGETVTMDGGWFSLHDARLYTRAESRPRLIVSAFGPQAAQIAGRHGDGLWTMGDPEIAGEVIAAYRDSCSEHGCEPGPVVAQTAFAWAQSRDQVIEGARMWKPTQLDELHLEDIHDPARMQRSPTTR